MYSSSFPISFPVKRFRKRQFAMRSKRPMARFDHVNAASTMAPVSIRAIPRLAATMPMFIPKMLPLKTSSQVAIGTMLTSKRTAPTPPATLTRNSMVCIPRIAERLFEVETFWSFRYRGVSMYPERPGVTSLVNIPAYWARSVLPKEVLIPSFASTL